MSVYFCRVRPDGPIKIGLTADASAEVRIATLQTGCPWDIDLIGCVEGTWANEQRLHLQLAEYRMRGEWFSPHENVLKTIASVLKDGFGAPEPPRVRPVPRPVIEPDPHLLEELRDRANGLVGAIHLHLPPRLSVSVRLAAEFAGVFVEDIIVDVLMDAFSSAVSRETSSSPQTDRAASPARSSLG